MAQEVREVTTTVIANGASLSAAVDLTIRGRVLIGIQIPAAWTAGVLTFQASYDGVTYANVFTSSELSLPAAASRFLVVDPADLVAVRYLKLRSGTSGTPVNQGAKRTLTLIVRPIE